MKIKIARLERDDLRQMCNQGGNAEDQLSRRAVLNHAPRSIASAREGSTDQEFRLSSPRTDRSANVSKVLPNNHCPPGLPFCQSRAETSCPHE